MIIIGKKQFIINLTEDLHKEIKRKSVDRAISMQMWILTAIIERLKVEQGFEKIPTKD